MLILMLARGFISFNDSLSGAGSFIGGLEDTLSYMLYATILIASKKQNTFGMRICGLIVVDKDMQRLSLARSFWRIVSMFIVAMFTLCLGFLVIAFRKDKRGLHDMMAGTYVLRGKRS